MDDQLPLPHCHGTNPRTGRRVGERHRWPDGWGIGQCKWCFRDLDQLRNQAKTLAYYRSKVDTEAPANG